jgi:hypothetical protein
MWTDSNVLANDFDETAYLRHSLHLPNFEAEQSRLNRCGEIVQQDIRTLVTENTDPLLRQVDSATKAEKEISDFRSVVGALGSAMKRLKHAVEDPHSAIQSNVIELQRTMRAVDTLRLLQKFLALVQKLPELVQVDVGRAARSLRDVEDILASNQLHGIETAERHFDSVTKLSAAIRSKAHELLKSATSTQNQADAATALQCFLSLGSLHKVIANFIAEHKRELTKTIMRELDAQSISQSIEQGASTDANKTRDTVFSKLELACGDIVHRVDSVMLLWKVLMKKKDPISHEPFHLAIKEGPVLLADLWSSVSQLLHERLSKFYKRGSFFLMIVAEYPRFFGALRSLISSVNDLLAAAGDRESGGRWLLATVEEPEKRFTALVQERHRDKMQQITVRLTTLIPNAGSESMHLDIAVDPARPQLPSAVTALDAKGLLKVFHQDVSAFRQDPHVLSLVLQQGIGSLQILCQRLQEALNKVHTHQLKSSFEGTAGQVFRFCIANAATTVYTDLGSIISLISADAGSEVNRQIVELKHLLRAFQEIVHHIIEPYFGGAMESLAATITSVVNDVSGEDSGLQRLTVTVGSVVSRFVLLLDRATPGLEDEENKLVETLLRTTVASSLLVRPLDPAALHHLLRCLVQVPQVVATIPHLPNPSTNHWRNQMKALKSLMAANEDSEQFEAHVSSVHPVIMMLHLSQRIPMSCFPSIGRLSGQGDKRVIEVVCDCLAGGSTSSAGEGRKMLLDWIARGFREYEQVSLDGAEEAKQRRWHLDTFQGLRRLIAAPEA